MLDGELATRCSVWTLGGLFYTRAVSVLTLYVSLSDRAIILMTLLNREGVPQVKRTVDHFSTFVLRQGVEFLRKASICCDCYPGHGSSTALANARNLVLKNFPARDFLSRDFRRYLFCGCVLLVLVFLYHSYRVTCCFVWYLCCWEVP